MGWDDVTLKLFVVTYGCAKAADVPTGCCGASGSQLPGLGWGDQGLHREPLSRLRWPRACITFCTFGPAR